MVAQPSIKFYGPINKANGCGFYCGQVIDLRTFHVKIILKKFYFINKNKHKSAFNLDVCVLLMN
jgi:hypothetical protein